jgi:tetratricopeptide (TPR) repeat protein
MRRMSTVVLVIALVVVGCSKSKPTGGLTIKVGTPSEADIKKSQEAEAKRLAEQKAAETKRLAEQKAAEEKRDAEEKQRRTAYEKEIRDGKKKLEAGKRKEAGEHFRAALKLYPEDREAEKLLARVDVEFAERLENYALAMSAGKSALEKKNYPGAINSFKEALKYKPNNKPAADQLAAATGLQKAEEARVAKAAEDQKKQREANYRQWMAKGNADMKAGKYADAEKAYDKALQIMPGDEAGIKGKRAALAALKAPPVDPTKKADEDYRRFMKQGDDSMKAKKYLDAVVAYDEALKIKPGDAAAIKGKKAAAEARKSETTIDPKALAKKQAYDKSMAAGRAAVKSGKYVEAITAFESALSQVPSDKVATAELADARKKAQDAANARRTAAYNDSMKQADTAMKAKKIAEALTAYKKALEFRPGDAAASKGKKDAEAQLAVKPKLDPKAKQREEDYQLAMSAGKSALDKKNYQGAVNSFKEALRIKPGDKAAATALESSEKLLAAQPKKPEEAYAGWMKKGDEAMKAKKYLDAVTAYDEALKIKPGDAAAIKGKKAAAEARKKQ